MENKQTILTELDKLSTGQAEQILRKVIMDAGLDVSSVAGKPNLSGEALSEAFGVADNSNSLDLEKQALAVLNLDPVMDSFLSTGEMQKMKEKPLHFNLDVGSLITTTTLALVVLSTYVHIKKDTSGQWTFEFRIKNSSESLKKELIKLAQQLGGAFPNQKN